MRGRGDSQLEPRVRERLDEGPNAAPAHGRLPPLPPRQVVTAHRQVQALPHTAAGLKVSYTKSMDRLL